MIVYALSIYDCESMKVTGNSQEMREAVRNKAKTVSSCLFVGTTALPVQLHQRNLSGQLTVRYKLIKKFKKILLHQYIKFNIYELNMDKGRHVQLYWPHNSIWQPFFADNLYLIRCSL